MFNAASMCVRLQVVLLSAPISPYSRPDIGQTVGQGCPPEPNAAASLPKWLARRHGVASKVKEARTFIELSHEQVIAGSRIGFDHSFSVVVFEPKVVCTHSSGSFQTAKTAYPLP